MKVSATMLRGMNTGTNVLGSHNSSNSGVATRANPKPVVPLTIPAASIMNTAGIRVIGSTPAGICGMPLS